MIRLFRKREESPAVHPPVSAVVVAAGGSTRMGVPKQMIPLRGIPVIVRTLQALDRAGLVDEIVLVARQEDMLPFYALCKQYEVGKVSAIVPGGATRQQSVAAGRGRGSSQRGVLRHPRRRQAAGTALHGGRGDRGGGGRRSGRRRGAGERYH